jgi:hypothetical protein
MPFQNGIYYQQQSGVLCRLHSLNGYFGKEHISVEQFNKYQLDYDTEYKDKFNFESSCKNFDMVASDQKNTVNYILKTHGIYTRYYAINQIYNREIQTHILNILEGNYFFIYNESHIWGCRQKSDNWYKVDSLSGVHIMNINTLSSEKNIGFIIPVNLQKEFYINLNLIKSILIKSINNYANLNSKIVEFNENMIKTFLIQKNKEKVILGELEIPLSICMDVLETNFLKKNAIMKKNKTFNPIHKYVIKYNEFLSKFTKGEYNNIKLILNYLPNIILSLVKLSSLN